MPETNLQVCPTCGSDARNHYVRTRQNDETGERDYAGEYYGCKPKCRRLTFSPSTGKFNLRED